MKAPNKIKLALEICAADSCRGCPYEADYDCYNKNKDALAYIQQLENHIGELTEMVRQLERERDAAVEILHDFKMCAGCNHKGCADCRWFDDMTMKNKDLHDNWQWRGVQPEPPKEDA